MRRFRPDHQGWGLLVCGLLWAILGRWTWYGTIPAVHHPGAFHELIDPHIRAVIWVFTAGMAIASVWMRPSRSMALGALAFMPGLQAISYTFSWVLSWWHWWPLNGLGPGFPDGIYSAVVYLGLVGWVVYIAFEKKDTTADDLMAVLQSNGGHDG